MEFPEAVPSLWSALTDGDDDQDGSRSRWTKFTYPVDIPTSQLTPYQQKQQHKINKVNAVSQQQENQSVSPNPLIVTLNCTVTYLRQCMAENKCEKSCQSMGASSYRWFQDGCCECVGHNCINYGINDSRCLDCSYEDDDDNPNEDELSDEELDRAINEAESDVYD